MILTDVIGVSNQQSNIPLFSNAAWHPDEDLIAVEASPHIIIYTEVLEEVISLSVPIPNSPSQSATLLGIAWSPDGTKLATNAYSNEGDISFTHIIVWDSTTWEVDQIIEDVSFPFTWSPDSRYIVGAEAERFSYMVFDTVSESVINETPQRLINNFDWNPTNINEIAVGSGSNVIIANPFSGAEIVRLDYRGSNPPVYSPDGVMIAVTRSDDLSIVDVLDTINYQVLFSLDHENQVSAVMYDPALFWLEDYIATYDGEGQTYLWDRATGENVRGIGTFLDRTNIWWQPNGNAFLVENSTDSELLQNGIFVYSGQTGETSSRLLRTDTPYVSRLSIINSISSENILNLSDNQIVNIGSSLGSNLLIQAFSEAEAIDSVVFDINGSLSIDNVSPYTLSFPGTGAYTLTATPFSEENGLGDSGISLTVNFLVLTDSVVGIKCYDFSLKLDANAIILYMKSLL